MEPPSPPPSAALRELKRQSDLLDAINRKLAPVQLLAIVLLVLIALQCLGMMLGVALYSAVLARILSGIR